MNMVKKSDQAVGKGEKWPVTNAVPEWLSELSLFGWFSLLKKDEEPKKVKAFLW